MHNRGVITAATTTGNKHSDNENSYDNVHNSKNTNSNNNVNNITNQNEILTTITNNNK